MTKNLNKNDDKNDGLYIQLYSSQKNIVADVKMSSFRKFNHLFLETLLLN